MVDREGTLWVKTPAGPLLFLPVGQSRFQVSRYGGGATSDQAFLRQAPDGSIWLSDDHGLREIKGPLRAADSLSSKVKIPEDTTKCGNFTFDANGSLWSAISRGVKRFDHLDRWGTPLAKKAAPGERFTLEQGLSSDRVWKVLIDREGSIWVGTNSGLDQFRRNAFTRLSLPHTQQNQFAMAAGDHGSLWFGNKDLALTHMNAAGRIKRFPMTGQVACLRRDRNGTIWSAGRGKFHLWRFTRTGLLPMHYPKEDLEAIAALEVDRSNDLWISTIWANAYHLDHNVWIRQNEALGKRPGLLGAMTADDVGNVWFGFSHNLVRWDGSHYTKFPFTDSRFEISVTTMAVRSDHVWLAGTGGVVLFTQGHYSLMRWRDPNLPGRVSGIVQTERGDLWMNGFSGVAHVSANELAKWLRNPNYAVSAEHFDALDGLPGFSAYRVPEPSVLESRDGRLWFATTKGIAWLDPVTFERNRNRVPPPVIVSSVLTNNTAYPGWKGLTLPARTQNLQIDYTALSLAIPERVMFRYQLDGIDKDWQDAGTRRVAFYTNLKPGTYRFHVIACNNDGVWNEQGASLQFRIAPAWYQTIAFKLLMIAIFVGMALLLFLFDRQRYATLLRVRFDERLEERTRLARELHDTLLQTIQASKLVADEAQESLSDTARTRWALERLSQWLYRATVEGRAALDSLRNPATDTEDLASALRCAAEVCVCGSMRIAVSVSGVTRPLHPIACGEVFRIGEEAIRNARHHSGGTTLGIEVHYGNSLVLRVRDDGCGLNRKLAESGKPGHFGITGMRERARNIGGRLVLDAFPAKGTCVTLTVPGPVIFKSSDISWLAPIFRSRRSQGNSSGLR
jgi:ligand-binding sensor domain-containing protein